MMEEQIRSNSISMALRTDLSYRDAELILAVKRFK